MAGPLRPIPSAPGGAATPDDPAGMTPGLILAAPASGSGKTVLTLALLRHLRRRGVRVASAKLGPDYIDPAFHAAASARPCFNLDSWAMRRPTFAAAAVRAGQDADLVIAEAVMGLFDGAAGEAPGGGGSSAEAARLTGWPIVLVVDAKGMAASAAALVHGFATYRPDVAVAAAIFNKVGGAKHKTMLREACASLGVPILGCVPRRDDLVLPERHLGLVQAGEHGELETFLEASAAIVGGHIDIDALVALARPCVLESPAPSCPIPPLGQHIAVAHDVAFAFSYPLVIEAWRAAGAHVSFFSPLADGAPGEEADAVYLPGGYPELHAGRLAARPRFLAGLRAAAARGATIYGECGGYMVLGQGLIDAKGTRHAMAGLLALETSFAQPRRSLGYREAEVLADGPLGPAGSRFRGHEFHYADTMPGASGERLFRSAAAGGGKACEIGRRNGSVMGSFLHLIDRAPV